MQCAPLSGERGAGGESKNWHFLYLLVLLILNACEAPVDWQFHPEENGALVVESIITNEMKTQEVLLSLSYSDLNGEAQPATGAEVKVLGAGQTWFFQEDPDQPGRYLSESAFAGLLHVKYQLQIGWNSNTYAAENFMVQVIPYTNLTFNPVAGTDSLTFGNVPPTFSPHEQAMYEIHIDWSHLTGSDSARAKVFFYTFNTLDVNQLLRPPKERILFPRGSIIIGKKYSLNPDFANYFRALAAETEWQGGILDEASASLPTNVSNGGLGFFGVSAVLSDTLVAE